MSNKHLILPEIDRMIKESKTRSKIAVIHEWADVEEAFDNGYNTGYECGFQDALAEVKKFLLGIGVHVQSTKFGDNNEQQH